MSQVTVTAPTGPGFGPTPAKVFTDIRSLNLTPRDTTPTGGVASIMLANGVVKEFDLAATTTITVGISAGVITAVISQ